MRGDVIQRLSREKRKATSIHGARRELARPALTQSTEPVVNVKARDTSSVDTEDAGRLN